MGVRRFTRLTNAFSKKLENYVHVLDLYFVWYNWCRCHTALRTSPAQAAGLTDALHDAEWLVDPLPPVEGGLPDVGSCGRAFVGPRTSLTNRSALYART